MALFIVDLRFGEIPEHEVIYNAQVQVHRVIVETKAKGNEGDLEARESVKRNFFGLRCTFIHVVEFEFDEFDPVLTLQEFITGITEEYGIMD